MKSAKPSLPEISTVFAPRQRIVVFPGDCLELLRVIPDATFQLVVTSPPYNLGKEYERRVHPDHYVEQQRQVIRECVRTLKPSGSICWEVGNFVDDGAIVPQDRRENTRRAEPRFNCRGRKAPRFWK